MILAGPAGAVGSTCNVSMNPAAGGNASGLNVACIFASGDSGSAITITDYPDAVWHYGAARNVNVTVTRTASSTAGQTTIKSRPTNNLATPSCANSPAGQLGIPAGNLEITAADINHSVEFATSSATKTGVFINPGTFIKNVVASGSGCTKVITVTLSKATLAGGPLCPASPGPATGNCANSVATNVLVSNATNRDVTDGVTTAGSACVASVSANFKASDVGALISGGDLPDGAKISAFPGTGCGTATTSVQLSCAGCVGGFTGVSSASNQVITLSPGTEPTSARYVTDITAPGTNKVITSTTAVWANSDIGLPVSIQTSAGVAISLPGARIASISGNTATLSAAANVPSTAKRAVVGLATKTAPATGDVQGTLAILLQVNPTVSPTSPPCAANKISGFQIPLQWKNPGAYNTQVAAGTNQFSGTNPAPTSIAQLDFNTASTSFSGYVEQHYTVTGGVPNASNYTVEYRFLPVAVGLCPGTGDATTFNFSGLTVKSSSNPSFTGGGGGGARGILTEPQGTTANYTANVSTNGASQPSVTSTCTITSPAAIQIGC
jgi:hypothetical protein